MTVGLVLAAAVAVALVTLIARLYRRVGRSDWGRSDLRLSTLAFLAAVGPMFGIRVRREQPEKPAFDEPYSGGAVGGPVGGLDEQIAADAELQAPPPVRDPRRRPRV